MKKILTLICTLLCANVLMAQTRFIVGELQYEVTGTNKVEVHDCMPSATSIVIPDTVTYQEINYCVTSIGNNAFAYCSSLTSVTIPNSVTSIENDAFSGCSILTSITIPNSVTSIGRNAFSYCSSLTSVTIPNSVTSIEEATFDGCSILTSITIPNSVTSIGRGAFSSCWSLTSVTIPNSVTSIGSFAFAHCSSLTSVDIPNSVTSIGEEGTFYDCRGLTSVTIGNSVISIGYWAFESCSRLISVTIPNSVTSIGYDAFRNCSSLTSITIPNSVTSIGYDAFSGCSSLTSVTIEMNNIPNLNNTGLNSTLQNLTLGENVTSIASGAFNNCYFLQNVTCLATTPPTIADNTVFPYPNIATLTVPCGSLEAYSAPTSFWNMFFAGRISGNGYNVVATANDNAFGSVAVESDCSTAMLTATANEGYVFLSWNDGNTENPRVVPLTSDTSFVANFIPATVNTDITATICQGQTYTENGFNVSEAGVYTQNLTSINGGDSIVTLTLNVNPIFNTELTATICQGQTYTENNFNVSEAGVYTQTLTSVNGCDSIVTLTLNVNPIFNTELTATICEGQVYTENNFNVSEAGVYTQNLQTVNGCDSIVTLTLNVNPIFNTELSATICEGQVYTENNFNVSESGVYTQTLTSVNSCDSIVTLTLNVNPIFNTELTATICEGQVYTENNFNISEAGVYTQTLTSVNGCDSIVTLTLNVNPIYNTELSATICEGQTYTENNFNVSEAGVYTQTLQTVNGCDSIVTLTLNVNPIFNTELSATICEGQTYTENNFNVSEAGVYTQTLTSANGCDSIVTLTLNVNPIFNTELSATICEGQVYNEQGFNVSEAGVYTQTLTSVSGCDSIVTLTLNVNPVFDTTINATINAGETYASFGFNETEAGTYVQNLQTVNGCDSTITLILDVNSSLMDVEDTEISFYPNPTDSKVIFSQMIEKIEVIDLTGKVIFTFRNESEINVESLPAGAYYLRLTNDEKTSLQKVIKQ